MEQRATSSSHLCFLIMDDITLVISTLKILGVSEFYLKIHNIASFFILKVLT